MVHRVSKVKQNLHYNRSGRFGYTDHASWRYSLSGRERSHLFVNEDGRRFIDVSGISGADHPGDGRAFAKIDFDRDGWTDLAVMNANAPAFTLYRNEIGRRSIGTGADNEVIAVRLAGGNRSAHPATGASNRDGVGARFWVSFENETIVREYRAGEGMAAQNSATQLIGIGPRQTVQSLKVRWPSGTEQTVAAVPAGTLVTVYEDPAHSPTGEAFVFETYRRSSPTDDVPVPPRDELASLARFALPAAASLGAKGRLRLYTATATWCPNCKRELPQLERLRAAFNEDELAMFGVPVDDTETRDMFEAYVAEHRPAYDMLIGIAADEQATMRQTLSSRLKSEGIPATLVTDAEDHILHVSWGVPSLSTLHKLLALIR